MSEQDPTSTPRSPLDIGGYRALEWTDEHVRRFWEYESQIPDNYFSYGYRDRLVPRLRGSLSGKKRVLDFGCGGGFLIPALSRVAGEVYGVDFSPTSVELTNERNANIANFRGATSPMEALDAGLKFDGILSVEVIEHLSDEQLAGTLDIIKRLLTPGGVIAFTTPNDEDLGAWGQVRRAFRAIGNGRDTGLPHRVASGTLP